MEHEGNRAATRHNALLHFAEGLAEQLDAVHRNENIARRSVRRGAIRSATFRDSRELDVVVMSVGDAES